VKRRFGQRERATLFVNAGGYCQSCGKPLTSGWHADHQIPYSAGGPTRIANGAALCPRCNTRKGAYMPEITPRAWQSSMVQKYVESARERFIISVCPAAGKTLGAGFIADEALRSRDVERVVVVVPSDELRTQTAAAFHRLGISLDPRLRNDQGVENHDDYRGCVVSYQQVERFPSIHALACRRPTLVIFDEIHHVAEGRAWGNALEHAFAPAHRVLAMTGTLWRREPGEAIPFLDYDEQGVPRVDFSYGYAQALNEKWVRPVRFRTFAGQARWLDYDGEPIEQVIASTTEIDEENLAIAQTSALRAGGPWVEELIREADAFAAEAARTMPDAGVLLVARDQAHAHRLAVRVRGLSGYVPTTIVSGDTDYLTRLAAFRKPNGGRWCVSVRVLSEGVDVPRLLAGVYLTNISTELYFRQFVGRLIRRRPTDPANTCATVFMGAFPHLVGYAEHFEGEIAWARQQRELREDESIEREDERERIEMSGRQALDALDFAADVEITHGERIDGALLADARALLEQLQGMSPDDAARLLVSLGLPHQPEPKAEQEQPVYERVEQLRRELKRVICAWVIPLGHTPDEVYVRLCRAFDVRSTTGANVRELEQMVARVQRWKGEPWPAT
jgi:superfamily II DNA or RNA helicase